MRGELSTRTPGRSRRSYFGNRDEALIEALVSFEGMSTQEIPVVDIAPLRNPSADPALLGAAVSQIGEACRGVGFFVATGHGIADEAIDSVFAMAQKFFALPTGLKASVSIDNSSSNRGWVGMRRESLDPDRGADLKEAYNIGLEGDPGDPVADAQLPFRGPNQWPADAGDFSGTSFREQTLAYFNAAWALGLDIHQAFAIDLGLTPDYFSSMLDRPMATLRLLRYPGRAADGGASQLGAGEHTDYGNVTLLMTRGVGGLEVRTRDGQWLEAPLLDNAFVCNIGDCLMRWTNEVYVSTPHRVQVPDRERYSVAFFLDPNPDAIVAALPSCVDDKHPAAFPPIAAADYLAQRLAATY